MRKIINSTFITLDGAVENPHLWPSLGETGSQASFDIQTELLSNCDAVLMGRRTYDSALQSIQAVLVHTPIGGEVSAD